MLLESGNQGDGFGVEYLGIMNLKMTGLIPAIAISCEERRGLVDNYLLLFQCEGVYLVCFLNFQNCQEMDHLLTEAVTIEIKIL